jgi:hypothetical protein
VLARNGTYGFEFLHKSYSVEQLSRILRKASILAATQGPARRLASAMKDGQGGQT